MKLSEANPSSGNTPRYHDETHCLREEAVRVQLAVTGFADLFHLLAALGAVAEQWAHRVGGVAHLGALGERIRPLEVARDQPGEEILQFGRGGASGIGQKVRVLGVHRRAAVGYAAQPGIVDYLPGLELVAVARCPGGAVAGALESAHRACQLALLETVLKIAGMVVGVGVFGGDEGVDLCLFGGDDGVLLLQADLRAPLQRPAVRVGCLRRGFGLLRAVAGHADALRRNTGGQQLVADGGGPRFRKGAIQRFCATGVGIAVDMHLERRHGVQEQRQRLKGRYERWQRLTPEQRERVRRSFRWYRQQSPEVKEMISTYITTWRYYKPPVTGADLISIGFTKGKYLGDCLRMIRDKGLNGEIKDFKDAVAFAQTMLPADKVLKGAKERNRIYRRYVYEAGAIDRPE